MLDEVLFLCARADSAFASARLVPVDVHGRPLDVPRMAHRDRLVGVRDQIFELDLLDLVHDLRAPVVAVSLLHLAQFVRDHLLQPLLARQDLFQLRNALADGLQFLQNLFHRELREPMEL